MRVCVLTRSRKRPRCNRLLHLLFHPLGLSTRAEKRFKFVNVAAVRVILFSLKHPSNCRQPPSSCTLIKHDRLAGTFIPWLFAHRVQSSMEESKGKELSYGWLKLRPRWLQFLNTPKWFLFFLCQYFFTQSIIVNGVYPGSISTIEKRFGFTRLVMAHNNSLIINKFQGLVSLCFAMF